MICILEDGQLLAHNTYCSIGIQPFSASQHPSRDCHNIGLLDYLFRSQALGPPISCCWNNFTEAVCDTMTDNQNRVLSATALTLSNYSKRSDESYFLVVICIILQFFAIAAILCSILYSMWISSSNALYIENIALTQLQNMVWWNF